MADGNTVITIDDSFIIAWGGGSNSVRVESAAEVDDERYGRQTVTVNGQVIGNAAGVYLDGGGRVVIGPQGSVGAASGIAILATGDTPPRDDGRSGAQAKALSRHESRRSPDSTGYRQ